jgi:hypothetical protein
MRLLSVAAKLALLVGVVLLGFNMFSSPTIVAAADSSLCGAPANPWGITYCQNGGAEITQANLPAAPSSICSPGGPFDCVSDFATAENGYMVECAANGRLSMSGGVNGVCSDGDGGPGATAHLGGASTSPSTSPPTTAPPVTTQPVAPPTTAPPVSQAAAAQSSATQQAVAAQRAQAAQAAQAATSAAGESAAPLAMTGPGRGVALIAVIGAGLIVVGGVLQLVCYGPRRRRAVQGLWSAVAHLLK